MRSLKIKASMVLNLAFANNIIFSCFFFLIIYLHFETPAVIAQIFNPIVELIILIGIPSKETKAEIETHPVTLHKKQYFFLSNVLKILCFQKNFTGI